MSVDEIIDSEDEETELTEAASEMAPDTESASHSNYKVPKISTDAIKHHLSGMYQNWFLDYASYVILERAVPDVYDGLKPVQRRILHSMKRLDDGRYNKVANIVGHTMQFHPHGDASIGDALVQLGQKDLLIDCQGNWGNILTGDSAAAPRYIEARLSKFALETVFNPKTTEWKSSYDGRNKEPVALPVKFPLVLAQGVEGIAVGLNSKILPHNFNELLDACIAHLKGEAFILYPDFQTGGSIDVSRYNDGERGGAVKIRAKIGKVDNKTLAITEIPFGTNTSKLIESIIRASDKGKIKIRKVDDNTAANVEILVHLIPGSSSDKTIDALFAFTDCELSISPNCCVIHDNKPRFTGVSEMLRISCQHTVDLLQLELEIQKGELQEQLFFTSLEKIFIENRIYKDKGFEESNTQEEVIAHIDHRLEPFKPSFIRELTREDILKLLEIKMMRITKFDTDKANDTLLSIQKKIEEIDHHLAHIVDFTIAWYTGLKTKYGKDHPRMTEIRNFETIVAAKVVEANEKLYVNREEGFIGTSLRKDEFVCNCSDIDDIIIFFKDGRYKIVKVVDKMFVGKNILHLDVFKKNDKRTVYNAVYRDGKIGPYYIKRFAVNGITREKDYDITQGTSGSKVVYFTVNPNAEAEVIRVTLKPKPRLNKLVFEKDFSEIAIKGRQSMGNILTKNDIHKIALKQKGGSTLGGRQVWFDRDVLRLNYDNRGEYLGEFQSDETILVVSSKGEYYTSNFDLANHYDKDIMVIEKFDSNKVWSVVLYDAEQKFNYLKRFQLEPSQKPLNFLGESAGSRLLLMSDVDFPRFEVVFGGNDAYRETMVVDAEEFIGIKSYKAKGKRLTTFEVETINELEPLRFKEPSPAPATKEASEDDDDNDNGDNNEGPEDTELNGTTGIEEEFEDIVDPEIPAKTNETEPSTPELTPVKAVKPKKEKPVKPTEPYTDSEGEIIDTKKIIDDITGQLNLFD
ncbi:MAG: DNA gyrase/topoisomerase IV subunit A [Paludibacter sp.]|nr:DNA gyrase/topoisomerase IV subunit A [Paludibacter sp.]